jgi:hypothetical protein
VKVAVTALAFDIGTVHEPFPEHAPAQPSNVEPADTAAMSDTLSPSMNVRAQVSPQSIPAGELVTVPDPVPAFATASWNLGPSQFFLSPVPAP